MKEDISDVRPEQDQTSLATRIGLREAEKIDEQFLISVYRTTREPELAMVPWSEEQRTAFVAMQYAAQAEHYRQHYPASRELVISLDGKPAGRIYIHRGAEEIRILDVTVLPSFQNRGIGGWLIRDLQREAADAGKSLTIYVENYNPSMSFFEKRGFTPIGQQGVHVLMGWKAVEPTGL